MWKLAAIVSAWKFVLLALMSIGTAFAQETGQCRYLLFATDFDNSHLGGSKEVLIDAVERGDPIRLGWELDFDKNGEADILHWADASVLTLWEGEVFTQVQAIHRQHPLRGEGEMHLSDEFIEWRASMGTTGRVEGAFSNGQKMRSIPARIYWCAAVTPDPVWTPVYKNGLNGEPLEGSKDDLLAAIRAGQPIQIGWGMARELNGAPVSIEHLAEPLFIRIGDDSNVVVQLPEHVAPKNYRGRESEFFGDSAALWRGLLSTNGTFDAVWANRTTGEVIRRSPQRAVMTWYVQRNAPLARPSRAIDRGSDADERSSE